MTRNVWTVARKNFLLKALWNILLKLHFSHSFLTLFIASIKVSPCCISLMLFFFFLISANEKGTSCFNTLLCQPMIHPPARGAPKSRSEQAIPLSKIFFLFPYKILPDWIDIRFVNTNSAILCLTHSVIYSTNDYKAYTKCSLPL